METIQLWWFMGKRSSSKISLWELKQKWRFLWEYFWEINGFTMVIYGEIYNVWKIPSGNLTVCYWNWPFSSLIYLWKIVIFHSYVSLPEGISVDFIMCERKHIRKPFAFQSNIGVPAEFSDQSQDLRETQNPTINEQQYGRNSAPSALRIRPSPDIRTRSLASKKKGTWWWCCTNGNINI